MKSLLVFLSCLFCYTAFAQKLTITVIGSPDSSISVLYPVSGTSYFQNKKLYPLDVKKQVTLKNEMSSAGILRIFNDKKANVIFVEPGQSLNIYITGGKSGEPLKIEGPNARGIEQAQKLVHPFYQSKGGQYFKKDTTIAGIKRAIGIDMAKEIKPFDSLLSTREISPQFYKYVKAEIQYYYAGVLVSSIVGRYNRNMRDKDYPQGKAYLPQDFDETWSQIYKDSPPNEVSAFATDNFFYYASDYVLWYKLLYLNRKRRTPNETFDIEKRFINAYNGFAANFKGSMLEYLQARYIHDEAMQKQYEPQLVDLFQRFQKSYPKSTYMGYISPLIQDIVEYQKKSTESFKADEILLDGTKINTFDELAGLFKGKIVFVDMWATWCGPCKEEFKYNAGLKAFLKANNVEMLYISMDKTEADAQWQKMIRYYELSGNHIRTSDALRQDLINKFWEGKGYSIPRYLILKDGKVVENNALRPSDKGDLYQQIKTYVH